MVARISREKHCTFRRLARFGATEFPRGRKDCTLLRIAQLVLESAGIYERKLQPVDAAVLARQLPVETWTEYAGRYDGPSETVVRSQLWRRLEQRRISLVHVYGPLRLAGPLWRTVTLPYVAAGSPPPRRRLWNRHVSPSGSTHPLHDPPIPEAVATDWFSRAAARSAPASPYGIGVFVRPGTTATLDGAVQRLLRFRDDCRVVRFPAPPTAEQLRTVDLWIDPARSDDDLDGFTAEALVCGLPVVASRTAINVLRLANGGRGFLVPRDDPNELVHAILTALFKPEITGPKQLRAAAEREEFLPERRAAHLLRLYESVS